MSCLAARAVAATAAMSRLTEPVRSLKFCSSAARRELSLSRSAASSRSGPRDDDFLGALHLNALEQRVLQRDLLIGRRLRQRLGTRSSPDRH